jgi:hypothetical protein
MKIRIGQIEIIDPTPEEFDFIVSRYAGQVDSGGSENGHSPEGARRRNGGTETAPGDRVVLERLIEAGNEGIPTQDLGEILGRRGKSIRPGLIGWAQRVGLVNDDSIDPFEDTRVGSRRGARLKPSFQPVARELLNRLA